MSNAIFPEIAPDVYGPLISGADVRAAVKATLDLWTPSYIEVVAERTGYDLISPFAFYSATYDRRQLPANGAASYWVTAFEEASKAHGLGGMVYGNTFTIEVQVAVYGPDWDTTENFAHAYGLAVRAALVQHGDLGTSPNEYTATGPITQADEVSTRWYRSRYQVVEAVRLHTTGVHQSQYHVWVNPVTNGSAGPKTATAPIPAPLTPGNEPVTAVSITVDKTGVDGTEPLGGNFNA